MNQLHRHLLTATLLAGFGLAAVAQPQTPPTPPAGPDPGAMMQGDPGRMMDPARFQQMREQRMARRLDELKRILQLTPQQEGAWNTWTAALKPTPHQRPDRAEFARMTTPERIDRIRVLHSQRSAEMDRRLEATKVFYGSLGAEQKRLFDAQGLRLLRGGEGRHGGGHMGHDFGR